ncbi:CZB domain-containing protein [Chromobacterium paludis]|uniref:Chemotaxis protein n=1 Tax=Chromobacterium paludis TaxID=2605945 RepID=A0A5C1DF08_9NEIS|nr:CZB domain-containing protein [Chromobacterium paludis]QEL55361.1 chemotaxis protein [Chromobacterium paludis]
MDLEQEILSHEEWKARLLEAIAEQARLDVDTLTRDDCCLLGVWLHGGGGSRPGRLAIFQGCLNRHRMLHGEIGRIALLINQGRYEEAEAALDAPAFGVAVSATTAALRHLALVIASDTQ